MQLHSAWFVHGAAVCILYLNGFSNALGRVFVAEGYAHSQFNSLGVAQSALLGRSGCYSSRKPGWLHVFDEWNTDFQVHNRITAHSAAGQILTVPLVVMKSSKKWAHNWGISMLKNLKIHLSWFFFFLKISYYFIFSCWIFHSNNHKKKLSLGFLVHLYWFFNGWSLKLVAQ